MSDYKPGSRWEHRRQDDARTIDIVGTVIESTPPRRLVLSWAAPADADNASKHSRIAFDIDPKNGFLRLTVQHEDLEPDTLEDAKHGWSRDARCAMASWSTLNFDPSR